MNRAYQPLFTWPGGKSAAAGVIWSRLGDVANFVDPFFGTGAALLLRPTFKGHRVETVNDVDSLLVNYWRAVKLRRKEILKHALWPVTQVDAVARRNAIREVCLTAQLQADPDWCDPKIAAWWVWSVCCTIGGKIHQQEGRPHLGNPGVGICVPGRDVAGIMDQLCARLRHVRVCAGDWTGVLTKSVLLSPTPNRPVGVLLDPPYDFGVRQARLYRKDSNVSADVRRWAIDAGKNPLLRIALCGLDGEHRMPRGWACVEWKRRGGFMSSRRAMDRIWFSPHCLKP